MVQAAVRRWRLTQPAPATFSTVIRFSWTLQAECLGERTVTSGHWLLLRTSKGQLGQWFMPRHRAVGLRTLDA